MPYTREEIAEKHHFNTMRDAADTEPTGGYSQYTVDFMRGAMFADDRLHALLVAPLGATFRADTYKLVKSELGGRCVLIDADNPGRAIRDLAAITCFTVFQRCD